MCPLLYPLSPTTRWGRRLGRPGPRRSTAPASMSCSKTTASCRCPGVRARVISWPPPAARRWTVVLKPPRLRPKASDSGSLLLPQPQADGLGSWCHRDHGYPSSAGHGRRLGLAPPRRAAPRCQPAASDRSDWRRCATDHSVRADPATGPRCAESRACRGGCVDDRQPAGRSWVFVEGAAVGAAPSACWSNRLGSYSIVYGSEPSLQTPPRSWVSTGALTRGVKRPGPAGNRATRRATGTPPPGRGSAGGPHAAGQTGVAGREPPEPSTTHVRWPCPRPAAATVAWAD